MIQQIGDIKTRYWGINGRKKFRPFFLVFSWAYRPSPQSSNMIFIISSFNFMGILCLAFSQSDQMRGGFEGWTNYDNAAMGDEAQTTEPQLGN